MRFFAEEKGRRQACSCLLFLSEAEMPQKFFVFPLLSL